MSACAGTGATGALTQLEKTVIREVSGDILLSRATTITRREPQRRLPSGWPALREKWPAMYKDFRHTKTDTARRSLWRGWVLTASTWSVCSRDPAPHGGGWPARIAAACGSRTAALA
jgi:hypothetical protein